MIGTANAQAALNQTLYVVHDSGTVDVIDVGANAIIQSINTGIPHTQYIAVNPSGGTVYVSSFLSNKIAVIPVGSNTAVTTISNPGGPSGMTVSNQGNRLYVALSSSNQVAVYNTSTYALITTINVGSFPIKLTLTPDGNKLYVSNQNSNNVSVINTNTYAVTTTIPVDVFPNSLLMSPDGNSLYCTCDLNGSVNGKIDVIAPSSDTVVNTFTVGKSPTNLEFGISPNNLWVANFGDEQVAQYQNTGTHLSTITPPSTAGFVNFVFTLQYYFKGGNGGFVYFGDYDIVRIYDAQSLSLLGNITPSSSTLGVIQDTALFTPAAGTVFNPAGQNVQFQLVSFFGAVVWTNITTTVALNSNGQQLFSGLTDNTGSVTFFLVPTTKYTVHFFNSSQGIDQTVVLFPVDQSYQINTLPNVLGSFVNTFFQTNQSYQIITGITSSVNGTGTGFINATYLDTSSTTTFVNMTLWQQDTLNGGPPTFVSFKNFTLAPAANEVINGDMENGLPSIPVSNNVVTSQSTNFSHTGTHSMFVNITGGGPVLELGSYATSSLTHYNLTVWVYSPGVSQTGFQIGLQETGGAFRSLQSSSASIPANTWTQVSVEMNTLSGWTATSNIILIGFGSTPTTPIYFDDISLTSNSATGQFVISSAGGKTFQVFINSTGSTFGNSTRNYAVSFPGPLVNLGFIDQSWYNWITLFVLIIILAIFTRITMGIGIIITDGCAAIATVMGWFSPFNNVVLNWSAIALIFIIGLAIYIIDKETGA